MATSELGIWRGKVFRAWPPSEDADQHREPWMVLADPGNGDLMVADSLSSATHQAAMEKACGIVGALNASDGE